MNDTTSNTGVVDPSILSGEAETGIPAFLLRHDADHQGEEVLAALPDQVTTEAPEFTTVEGEDGQVELAVEGKTNEQIDAEINQQLSDAGIPTGNLTHNPNSNQPASPEEMRRDFFKDVNKFGKASGEGASALGRLGLRALRAAADGILSTAKPAGGGKDDATLVYEAYAAMDSKHAEHTAGGAKANASKLRQIIGMGCMTAIADPVAIGDRVVRLREGMEGAELKPKALFAGLVDVAREQQASDTELSDDAIKGCLTKSKADKTLEKEWDAINKRIEGLITGEASHGLKDQSEAALKISQLVSEHIKAFKDNSARDDLVVELMERGYTRAMAENIVDKKD